MYVTYHVLVNCKQMKASCECGACVKCKNRIRCAVLRTKNPAYRKSQAEASKKIYWELSADERRLRSAERAEYQRQYRAANRERIAELNAIRYVQKREEERVKRKQYYKNNAEAFKARAKASAAANPQAVQQRAAKWNRDNPERRSIIGKVSSHKRRARIEGAGGTVTEVELQNLFKRQGGKCAGCKKRLGKFEDGKWHHDHVMPIALGGANTIENAQILCQSCNCRKQAKHPERWAAELGRLFA